MDLKNITIENLVQTLGTMQLQLINAQGYIQELEKHVKELKAPSHVPEPQPANGE